MPAHSPEWLVRWLALLVCFLLEPLNAVRLLRSGRLPSLWQARPDLPPGSAQAEAASIRGSFGTAIAWMCRRHGIGPGHAEWPELSRAIEAFGGSLAGFRAGAPACGLQWWENPHIVPGMVPGFSAPAAATASLLQPQAGGGALPPAPNAVQVAAAHAQGPASRVAASWLPESWWQVFARAGPGPSTGPPGCPGLPNSVMSNERGRSMASPAVLSRADRKSRARPGTAHAFSACDPLTFLPHYQ
ncbi:MAG TPA: hypothetical protein VGL95_04935 [Acetobacteraceae bacterium]